VMSRDTSPTMPTQDSATCSACSTSDHRETYDKEWYDYVDRLVVHYQDNINREEAATELIDAFQPYLNKYFRILRDGNININDKDSRKFIYMFIPDPAIRQALIRRKFTSEVKRAAYQAAGLLAASFETTPSEDIQQELIRILLTLADRYLKRRKRNSFAGYVCNAFRYELQRSVEKHTTDPLTYARTIIIRYNDEEYVDDMTDFAQAADMSYEDEYLAIPDEELDTNWIYGRTCSEIFEELSPLDRMILRMYYIEGMSDSEIADTTGYHINTIHNRRHGAIESIRDKYEDN
jgi:RNA polymerase sigma factor (sigma-70 family)